MTGSCIASTPSRWFVLAGSLLTALLFAWGQVAVGALPVGPPSYDDVPVLVCRLVVVESATSLVTKGTQLSETAFNSELERWGARGEGEVIVDEGFLLPLGGGVVNPHFDSAGGQVVASSVGSSNLREPGLTIRLGAQGNGSRYQISGAFGAWNPPGRSMKEGLTLTRVLRSPMEGRPPGILAGLQGCQPGREVEFAWETGLQQATAITGQFGSGSGAGARNHQSIFILPIAYRPSLVGLPGQPTRYQGGSLQVVEGSVPSAMFWRVVNHVRPDLARPPAYSGRLLDLYWPDEKWELFTKTMQQAGGAFAPLSPVTLANSSESQRVVGSAMVVRWRWQGPMPAAAFTIDMEDLLSDGVAGSEPLLRHCESHQGRWTLFARPVGEQTKLLAFRASFTGGEPVAVKALAVVDENTVKPTAAGAAVASRAGGVAQMQAPLDLYAGEWSGTINGQANSRVKMVCNWNSAKTQLMRDTSVTLDQGSQAPVYSSMIMKYDELAGKYHSQIVAKDTDTPSVAEGRYDPATRTFIWTAVNDLSGYTMVTRAVFPKEGVMDWTQTVTDREGRLVSQGGGKNLRQRR